MSNEPKKVIVTASSLVYEDVKSKDLIPASSFEVEITAKVRCIVDRIDLAEERYKKAHNMMVAAVCSVFEPAKEGDTNEPPDK
jgi:hypothetical protein